MKQFFVLWQWSWGIIQTLIGGLVYLIIRHKSECFNYLGATVCKFGGEYWGNITLGKFIFTSGIIDSCKIKHEYGHSVQSLIFGPFYLLLISIPAIIWTVFFKTYRIKNNLSYFSFYTEKLADKLGKVQRGQK